MEYNTSTEYQNPLVVKKMLEDYSGGLIIDPDEVVSDNLKPGAVVAKDSNNLGHVFKTAKAHAIAADDATAIKVKKSHEFKVGDFIATADLESAAYAITEIDKSDADYDEITVDTTLGVAIAEGDILVQAAAEAASSPSYKYTDVVGISVNEMDMSKDNPSTGVLRRGTVIEANMPYFVDSTIKALGTLDLVIFE